MKTLIPIALLLLLLIALDSPKIKKQRELRVFCFGGSRANFRILVGLQFSSEVLK